MRKKQRGYYERMFDEHGITMFCPVCETRPCEDSCRIGFTTEAELVALAALLSENDPRPKKKR